MTLELEYCEWDLRTLLDSGPLTQDALRYFLTQLLLAVEHCHRHSVIHRDLKPQNLLLRDRVATDKLNPPTPQQLLNRTHQQLELKLIDFGFSRVEGVPVKPYGHEAVTLWYRSPDALMGSVHYGLAIDLWSVGCIFAEMATSEPLFRGEDELAQLHAIIKLVGAPTPTNWPSMVRCPLISTFIEKYSKEGLNYPPALIDRFTPILGPLGADLLSLMLRYEPDQRISASQALRHPYFSQPSVPPQS